MQNLNLIQRLKRATMPVVTSALISLASIMPQNSQACTGYDQIGSGGTGITTAENSECSYWNPALSCKLHSPEISYAKLVQGVGDFRYNNIISFAMPVKERYGFTAQYSNSDTLSEMNRHEMWDWCSIGAGAKVSDEFWPFELYVGGDIALNNYRSGGMRRDGTTKILDRSKSIRFDASILAAKKKVFSQDDEFRLGFLVQDIGSEENFNVRPEISYIIRDKLGETSIAVAYYNLLNIGSGNSGPRAGIDRTFKTRLGKIALMAGYAGAMGESIEDGLAGGLTAGIGFDSGKWGIGLANYGGEMTLIEGFWRF